MLSWVLCPLGNLPVFGPSGDLRLRRALKFLLISNSNLASPRSARVSAARSVKNATYQHWCRAALVRRAKRVRPCFPDSLGQVSYGS